MADIEGGESITPQMRQTYKEECARGVKLFQDSLKEFQKSQIPAQKEEFKDVMDKALQVIRETASMCLSKEMQKEETTLESDYNSYIANPTPEGLNKLNNDLEQFQKNV